MRGVERVLVAEQVEARKFQKRRPGVKTGVRLPADDLDVMAELGQLARDVSDINALAAAMRLAAVGQQRNA
jgi:hypothetical protein